MLVPELLLGPFALLTLAAQLDLKQQLLLRMSMEAIGPIESDEDEVN